MSTQRIAKSFILSALSILSIGFSTASTLAADSGTVEACGSGWFPTRTCHDTEKKLAFADKNGINYRILKVPLNLEDASDALNFSYSIEFPKLTKPQYDLLMERFKGQKLVPWQEGKVYYLIDFLAPKIQAMLNRTLEHNYVDIEVPDEWQNPFIMLDPTRRLQYGTGMSCWDAAYEIARDIDQPFQAGVSQGHLFHIGFPTINGVMKNEKYYDPKRLQEMSSSAVLPGKQGFAERNRDRRIGDVLMIDTLVTRGQGAAHVMTWLDDDLFVEKTSNASNDPFRLVFYEDGVRNWLSEITNSDENKEFLLGTFYTYLSLPDPSAFTGKHYDFDWELGDYPKGSKPAVKISDELAKNYIWTQELSIGGAGMNFGLSFFRTLTMGVDAYGRATFIGAEAHNLKKIFEEGQKK